jgi:uncharacterized protein involved in outer membrane biogenesis
MATSLAASIKDHYEIEPVFVKGHDGIFEVSINGDRVYTNNSECSILPETSIILEEIRLAVGNPIKPLSSVTFQELSLGGAAWPLSGTQSGIKQHVPTQQTITGLQDDRAPESSSGTCGCDCDSC